MEIKDTELEKLKQIKILNIPDVARTLNVSYTTAERILVDLERQGKLRYSEIRNKMRRYRLWYWLEETENGGDKQSKSKVFGDGKDKNGVSETR